MNEYEFDICTELSPKLVAKAFWVGEVEHELRRIGREDYRFHKDEDVEKCMEMIDGIRRQTIYPHPASECSEECRLRGMCLLFSCLLKSKAMNLAAG